jgi:hypothetical protein
MCNAILDERLPNSFVVSPTSSPPSAVLVEEIMNLLSSYRCPTLRVPPSELFPQWREFLFCLCSDESDPLPLRRKLFFVAPHLLSLQMTKVSNRNDLKRLRSHLGLLSQKVSARVTRSVETKDHCVDGRAFENKNIYKL